MNKKYITCQEIFEAKLLIVEDCFTSLFTLCADPDHINNNSQVLASLKDLSDSIDDVFNYKAAVQNMADLIIPESFVKKYLAKKEKED
jgi:hypothetical protein